MKIRVNPRPQYFFYQPILFTIQALTLVFPICTVSVILTSWDDVDRNGAGGAVARRYIEQYGAEPGG